MYLDLSHMQGRRSCVYLGNSQQSRVSLKNIFNLKQRRSLKISITIIGKQRVNSAEHKIMYISIGC